MAHDVFISYASGDKPIGDAVCAALEARGVRCWIAPRDILPGVAFSEAIVGAIQASRVFVLVFSSRSNTSPHVMREVERAVSRGIPIIPLRIEDVPLSPSMEYFISTPHWLDALTPPLRKHLVHLADTVALLLARAEASAADVTAGAATATPATVAVGRAPRPALPYRLPTAPGLPAVLVAIALIAVLGLAGWAALRGTAGTTPSVTPSPSVLAVGPTAPPSVRGQPSAPSGGPSFPAPSPAPTQSSPVNEPVITAIAPVPGDSGAGLAWDGTNIWVSGGTEIFKMDPSGRVLGVFTPPDYTPEGLTWDGSRLWLFTTDSSTIYRFSVNQSAPASEPRVTAKFAAPNRMIGAIPHALAWDGVHLWFSDFYAVSKLDTTGRVLQTLSFGQEVVGLAAEAGGLWLAFANWPDDATLQAVRKSGEVVASFSLPLVEVSAMAWADGHLLVAGADTPGGKLLLHRVVVKGPW